MKPVFIQEFETLLNTFELACTNAGRSNLVYRIHISEIFLLRCVNFLDATIYKGQRLSYCLKLDIKTFSKPIYNFQNFIELAHTTHWYLKGSSKKNVSGIQDTQTIHLSATYLKGL